MRSPIQSNSVSLKITKYWLSLEPFLDENSANAQSKPTLIERGIFHGYSLPTYAAGEELHFRLRVPYPWDGTTNPWFVALAGPSATEDLGDKFKFQLEYQASAIDEVIPATYETLTDEVALTNASAYFATIIGFELDATKLNVGENIQYRLRRIAASSPEVTNEVAIWHWDTRWKMDKLGTDTTHGS